MQMSNRVLLVGLGVLALAALLLGGAWLGTRAAARPQPQTAWAAAPAQGDAAQPRTLTVTGVGRVTLSPDLARVTLAVETRHRSLAQAVAENNRRAQAVMDALRRGGVAAEDIRTANFSVAQERSYDPQGNLVLGPYQVTNQVVVTIRDLSALGTLLEAALEAGANRIDGLTFGAAGEDEALLQARLAAVADAKTQAEAIAQAAGVRIVGVQSIAYAGGAPAPGPVYLRAEAADAVPVSPGILTIEEWVTIVYLIE